jgi:glyoxylase-like metal-dependent hydrolase (beta-lactamase superfamily II)
VSAAAPARQVLAVKYGYRVTSRAESYLNYHLYGEPDADLDIDYYFWVISGGGEVVLVDTGFAPEVGDRKRRAHYTTPADVLPALGIGAGDVTAIVISHAHWDHTGNVRQFPRAQLVMSEAEYAFWTSPLAGRAHFAAHSEPGEIALLAQARKEDRLTLFTGGYTLAPGIELTEVGGHTPGQLLASVATPDGGPDGNSTVVLASDALHFYEEVERDRPFAILADLPAMYRAYDTLAQLAKQPGTRLVAGHDPLVRARFARHAVTGVPGGVEVTDLSGAPTRPLPACRRAGTGKRSSPRCRAVPRTRATAGTRRSPGGSSAPRPRR